MRRFAGLLATLTFCLCLVAQKDAAKTSKGESLFSEIDSIDRDLEGITGLKFKQKVPSAVYGKNELRKFLSHRIDKVMKPQDVKAEALILKLLGLVPDDYDLKQETVDLLTEQAAAFYDYQKKKLFVMEGGDTGEGAIMALAHELSHALADQNFHLERYIKQNGESDDAASARMAVMEGQASWLMSAYLHQRAGLGPDVPKPILDLMSNSMDEGAAQYPVYGKSPLYVQQSLVFPYKAGMLFQDAVFRKLGKDGFAEVFRRAPVSTQQIMHPDRYLEHRDPKLPPSPRLTNEKQFRKLGEGTLGEFDYHVLIEQYGSKEQADSLAAGLAGSQFTLWEHKREANAVLSWASQWESPGKAREFFEFYKQVLRKKAKKPEPGEESDLSAVGRNEYGFYRVQLKGDAVESVEGLKSSLN